MKLGSTIKVAKARVVGMTNYISHLEKLLAEYGNESRKITIWCTGCDGDEVPVTGAVFKFSRDMERVYLSNASIALEKILEIYAKDGDISKKIYPAAQE